MMRMNGISRFTAKLVLVSVSFSIPDKYLAVCTSLSRNEIPSLCYQFHKEFDSCSNTEGNLWLFFGFAELTKGNKRDCSTCRPYGDTYEELIQDSEKRPTFSMCNNGGWMTPDESRVSHPGPCTIERISSKNLSQQKFLEEYAFNKPVVIENASVNKFFQELTRYENLLEHYGHTVVKLSSANTYSYDKRHMTFKKYCESYLKPQSLESYGNETFYFFGDNSNEEWFDLFDQYSYPLYSLPHLVPQLSFGVAGPGSGVPFHFHGPGFAETLWGRKRWFMYPPHLFPTFHPNRTTLQWLHEEYPKAKTDPNLLECTLGPGELIYFPDHWWHATLNIDTAVFMSTFLSP